MGQSLFNLLSGSSKVTREKSIHLLPKETILSPGDKVARALHGVFVALPGDSATSSSCVLAFEVYLPTVQVDDFTTEPGGIMISSNASIRGANFCHRTLLIIEGYSCSSEHPRDGACQTTEDVRSLDYLDARLEMV